MTSTAYKISIMQAHNDGLAIEYSHRNYAPCWAAITTPAWNWGSTDYRIADKPIEAEDTVKASTPSNKRKTTDEKIAIMQAHAAGATLEFFDAEDLSQQWYGLSSMPFEPTWNWRDTDYRVKRQPAEIWVNEYDAVAAAAIELDHRFGGYVYGSPESAGDQAGSNTTRTAVHFREVMEGEE